MENANIMSKFKEKFKCVHFSHHKKIINGQRSPYNLVIGNFCFSLLTAFCDGKDQSARHFMEETFCQLADGPPVLSLTKLRLLKVSPLPKVTSSNLSCCLQSVSDSYGQSTVRFALRVSAFVS